MRKIQLPHFIIISIALVVSGNNIFAEEFHLNRVSSGPQYSQTGTSLENWNVRQAAEQGNPIAQRNLGRMYYQGNGVEIDLVESAKWTRKAAEQGDAFSQRILGIMYYKGYGVEKDPIESVKWTRKAAEQGDVDAQSYLGDSYHQGDGVKKDLVESAKWLRKAAEQESAVSQRNLGIMYRNGEGVEKDLVESVRWISKAAEQGDVAAQSDLGVTYQNGDGVKKDSVESAKWFRKAAEQGDATAQNILGNLYRNGKGVEKDSGEAVAWYRKAAEQGYADAQVMLGIMLYQGDGVQKDGVEALKWYRKAAEQGDSTAKQLVESTEKILDLKAKREALGAKKTDGISSDLAISTVADSNASGVLNVASNCARIKGDFNCIRLSDSRPLVINKIKHLVANGTLENAENDGEYKYQLGKYQMIVRFEYNKNRLSMITMSGEETSALYYESRTIEQCKYFVDFFQDIYGVSTDKRMSPSFSELLSEGSRAIATWRIKNKRVTVVIFPDSAGVLIFDMELSRQRKGEAVGSTDNAKKDF